MHGLRTLKYLNDKRVAEVMAAKDHTEADRVTEERLAQDIKEAQEHLTAQRRK